MTTNKKLYAVYGASELPVCAIFTTKSAAEMYLYDKKMMDRGFVRELSRLGAIDLVLEFFDGAGK